MTLAVASRIRRLYARITPDSLRINSAIPSIGEQTTAAMTGSTHTSSAIPETIGDAGVVVPAGDAPALAAALSRLGDATVRRPLALAGRARVMQQYSDDALAEQTIDFWTQVLRDKGNGSQ